MIFEPFLNRSHIPKTAPGKLHFMVRNTSIWVKKNPKPIPTAFKSFLDSLNTNLDYNLNQVLVNRYTGPDASLPSHSDDENDINPSSSIFKVSIGNSATVTFTNIKSGEESELIVEDRSLYRMTKDSQN